MNDLKITPKKKVLIAPLNWGLGHATRCIPIIEMLQEMNVQVYVASSGRALDLLKKETKNVFFLSLKDPSIKYWNKLPAWLSIFLQFFKLYRFVNKEQAQLNGLIEKHNFSLIISDNRYGFFSEKTPSVIITHQLNIQAGALTKYLRKITAKQLNKFDEIWIPDIDKKPNLTGNLSMNDQIKSQKKYVGWLSRFDQSNQNVTQHFSWLAILSGPEPERTNFEKDLIHQLKSSKEKGVILRGIPEGDAKRELIGGIACYNHLQTQELKQLILSSDIIICKSGYSTVMDLAKLGKKFVCLPTKGQTEQVYLQSFLTQHYGTNEYFKVGKRKIQIIDLSKVTHGSGNQNILKTLLEKHLITS